jgi:formylglycine-generating enzyme required for sulfatase activity
MAERPPDPTEEPPDESLPDSWEPEDSWVMPSAPIPKRKAAPAAPPPDEDAAPPAAPPAPPPGSPPRAAGAPGIVFAAPLPSGPLSEALPSSTRFLVLGGGEPSRPSTGPAISFAEEPDDEPLPPPAPQIPLLERLEEATGLELDVCLVRPPESPGSANPPVDLPPRYRWLSTLGEGGQGSVELVFDEDLGRAVALKTLHPHRADPGRLAELYREARITGQLDHPNIIPVYDAGQLDDGRLFYTMPRMTGQSLHRVLVRLRRGDPDALRRWDRVRLLQVLETACYAVGHAHSRGVVHRDLKPANILLGRQGEVYVVDWGIARIVGGPAAGPQGPRRHWSEEGDERSERVRGSPPYMAPEQIKHPDQVGPAADVFCLGVVLYEALCRVPPFQGDTVEDLVDGLCHSKPVPPRERAPQLSVPAELEEICLKALEKFPGHRFPTATELAEALAEERAGGRRRTSAARRLREAASMQARHRVVRARAAEAAARAAELEGPVGSGGDRDRGAHRAADEERRSLDRAADALLSEALWALHRALGDDPENPDAQAALGELYAERYAAAEAAGSARERAFFRALLRRFDDGRWGRWMRTGATLELQLRPEDASVVLRRLEDRAGELVPGEVLTPDGDATWELAPGRYAIEPTDAAWHYPVLVERGDRQRFRLDLRGREQVGPELCFVPGGVARLGGDPQAPGAGPERDGQVASFAIARHPVTVGAWARFLRWIGEDDPSMAAALRPPGFDPDAPDASRRPLTGVTLDEATTYCRWMTQATGITIRLPRADEWEKSLRGADRRAFPWGDGFDPERCAGLWTCAPDAPPPEVGAFPGDRSPFGVEDGAGGVWEWTRDAAGDRSIVLGGAFIDGEPGARAAGRRALAPGTRLPWLGFRVVQELRVD